MGTVRCAAAERILAVAPDGAEYPCTQLVGSDFLAGRLPQDDFTEVWTNSAVMQKYRRFRTNKDYKRSHCGRCEAKMYCGGCRVFAMDALGADPVCPYTNQYLDDDCDILSDIQASIGYTDAGFPLATLDQIEAWLEEDSQRDYPLWLMSKR